MTITVQDEIVVMPDNLRRLEEMFKKHYLCGARTRGLILQSMQVAPPVMTAEGPITLWVRWELADVGSFWAMRAQSGCAEVYQFWAEVDAFCLSRSRTYLTAQSADQLPAPLETRNSIDKVAGYRETAQLALRSESEAEALEPLLASVAREIPGLEQAALGRNLAPEYCAGHYTWDLLFTDQDAAKAARDSNCWRNYLAPGLERYCGAVHAFALDHIDGGVREPEITNGVKRTAYFRLLPGVDRSVAFTFERDLLEMPRHIPEIRNWRLSKMIPANWSRSEVEPWTYAWEQEFADLDGLTGPYMTHPHHWSHIDRWFDPESGDQIIDVGLSHAFSFFEAGILGREMIATKP